MERVESESLWFLGPCLADEFVGRKAFEGLEPFGEIVGVDECRQMAAELIMGFVMEAPDGGVLDRPVHALNLTIRPRVLGLGQAVIDIDDCAGIFEGMSSEWLLALNRSESERWRLIHR